VLPHLPPSLRILYCYNNKLTSLPLLNASLQELYCYNNKLTSLPPLSPSLVDLYCNNNELILLPDIHDSVQFFYWDNNPIHHLLNGSRENIHTFNHFRKYYFLSKLKKKFLSWMWKTREERIKEQFHYKHLLKFVEESDVNADLEPFLENFIKK
jgi:Leucine-rich repeat (LRR) protein